MLHVMVGMVEAEGVKARQQDEHAVRRDGKMVIYELTEPGRALLSAVMGAGAEAR